MGKKNFDWLDYTEQFSGGYENNRLRSKRIFGFAIMLILEWYHLKKKIWDLMSMISWNKSENEIHCDIIYRNN